MAGLVSIPQENIPNMQGYSLYRPGNDSCYPRIIGSEIVRNGSERIENMNTRFLGIMFALGALVVGINGLRNDDLDMVTSLCYVIWGLGGICGMIAMIRLNALGSNAIARGVGFLPMIG